MRHRPVRLGLAMRAGLFAVAVLVLGSPARAQIGSERYSAIVVDSRTGNVLVQASPDETRHPASLTKMMTLYIVFEALREGRLGLDSRVPFSEAAAARPPSKLGIPAGHSISLEAAILALVTRSANDVAAAVGERLGGSEERFAQMMTLRARALGMTRTTFRNASGLPDHQQVTTARDMATLGRRLIQDFPDRYHYFGMTHAQIAGQRIRNHNRMLDSYDGVDGIKTGYIRDSGFNIVTSASRGGQRLIGAVFGGSSWVERDAHMASLLDQGFTGMGIAVAAREDRPVLVRTAAAAPVSRSAARATPRAASRQAASRTTPRRQAAQPSRATPQLRAVSTTTTRRATSRPAAARPGRAQAKPPVRATQARPAQRRSGPTRMAAPAPAPARGTGTVRTAELR
jgi:D-alanyl-D-alanine carboxypeptidase